MTITIPLASASVGMQLASDLRDSNGAMLLPHASVLTAAMISAMQRRGITQVDVMNADDIEPPPQPQPPQPPQPSQTEQIAEISVRIDTIFRRSGGNANLQLQAAIRGYRLKEAS